MKKKSRSGLDQTIRRSTRWAAAVAVGGLTLLGFAGTANAGTASASGDCYNATVTWAASAPFGDAPWLTVEISGSDGSYVSMPASGTMDAQHETTYRLDFIAHDAIEQEDGSWADEVWGVLEVTTPARDPNCDATPPTTTPPTEVPPTEEVLPAEVPPTTEATATSVESAGPIVESVPPIAPEVLSSGLAAQAAGAELPATGRNTDLLLLAGTLTAAAGVSLLIIRRRSNTIAVD